MLRATARLCLSCDGRSLGHLLDAGRRHRTARSRPSPTGSPPRRAASSSTRPPRREGGRRVRAPSAARGRVRCTRRRSGPARRTPDPAASPAARGPGADALRFDNGYGGLTEAGDYQMRVRGDCVPPGALGERGRQPARRVRRERAGRRLHLGGEQLLLPAHPLAQRSGERPRVRGALPARRGERGALERDASADPPGRRRTPSATAPAPPTSSSSIAGSPPGSRSPWPRARR